jgi:integrase
MQRYGYAVEKYRYFCKCKYGVIDIIPPTEIIILDFINFMFRSGLQAQSMGPVLAGVRRHAILQGWPDFFRYGRQPASITAALDGAKRVFASSKRGAEARAHARKPATTAIVTRILAAAKTTLSPGDFLRLRLAILLCFLAGLRSDEVVPKSAARFSPALNLCFKDIRQYHSRSPDGTTLMVHIKRSKTDQLAQGRDIPIAASPGSPLDIVAAFTAWAAYRSRSGLSETIPLIVCRDGLPFTYHNFSSLLAEAVDAAGLKKSSITTHSFRKGGATTLAARGCSDADIKLWGNWKSNCHTVYVAPTSSHFTRLQSVLTNTAM